MANYSKAYDITLSERRASVGELGVPTFKEGDVGTSKILLKIRKDNKQFDLTGLKGALYAKDENENIYNIDDTGFEIGTTTGEITLKLSKEILDVPSKYVAQFELKDDVEGSVYTFEQFSFVVADKWSIL